MSPSLCACLFFNQSKCVCIILSFSLSLCESLFLCLCLYFNQSICVCIILSFSLSLCVSMSVCISISLYVSASFCPFNCLSVSPFHYDCLPFNKSVSVCLLSVYLHIITMSLSLFLSTKRQTLIKM